MEIKLGKIIFNFRNFREFLSIYKDVFIYKEYKFSPRSKAPFIIDCGTHIGIPLLYFKSTYPLAKIIAFEPNPQTFSYLKTNIINNKLKNVTYFNVALAKKNGAINFYTHKYGWNWGDAGVKNSWYTQEKYTTIKVQTKRLSAFIKEPVDLLKIDIEGMEVEVLRELGNKISKVKEIIIEFHGSKRNKQNSLSKLIAILEKNHFTYSIRYPYSVFHPFQKKLHIKDIKQTNPLFLIIHAEKPITR